MEEANQYEIIPCLVEAIVNLIQPSKIILFGSCARGCITRHSDIDLCIVVKEEISVKERAELRGFLTNALLDITDYDLDFLNFSEDIWKRNCLDRGTIMGKTLREGELLYGW